MRETNTMCGDNASLIKRIIEKGNLIDKTKFYKSEQMARDDKILKLTYNLEDVTYFLISKITAWGRGRIQSPWKQIIILQDIKQMGLNAPDSYIPNDSEIIYQFDLTKCPIKTSKYISDTHKGQCKALLIDLGVGGTKERDKIMSFSGNTWYFNFNNQELSFKELVNFKQILEETPKYLARYMRYFDAFIEDPFFWLIKKKRRGLFGYLYIIDVEHVERGDFVEDSYESQIYNLAWVKGENDNYHKLGYLHMNVFDFITKKPEEVEHMTKIFREEFHRGESFELFYDKYQGI